MNITITETKQLRSSGYSAKDIAEIRYAAKRTVYGIKEASGIITPISEEKALEMLGREQWLKAICKSAFSIHAIANTDEGTQIKLHSQTYIP